MTNYTFDDRVLAITDLGVTLTETGVRFRVWAPTTSRVDLAIYEDDLRYTRTSHMMVQDDLGVWQIDQGPEVVGKYYTYLFYTDDAKLEVVDPYAIACGLNSRRGMVVDLDQTHPPGWKTHKRPAMNGKSEAVLYETHVRDFSSHPESGMEGKGKYLAFTERGTRCQGQATGIDHLVEMGVTHVHLLPVYDYATVDESKVSEYNWGYDPFLFNVPEGSYSTKPSDGYARIRELKSLIQALHEAGLRVVLDVVYNHTYESHHSNLNRLLADFWYRTDDQGRWTNGSGCGNELATEKPMVRKFILDSLTYWLEEFQVDGFRFDLMGLYDVETVDLISEKLHEIRPDILLYGEPWVGWESGLPEADRMLKGRQKGKEISLFNDDYRNAIKGDNDGHEIGFVQGRKEWSKWIRLGIAGSVPYRKNLVGFTCDAMETVNYASSHDNLVLSDKIDKTHGHWTLEDKIRMNRLALTLVLTSFGLPFLQAGTEFGRTKMGHHNSYNAGDQVNWIDWQLKTDHGDLYAYIRQLIAFRKDYGFFAKTDAEHIQKHLQFKRSPDGIIAYTLRKKDRSRAYIVHNGLDQAHEQNVPNGKWVVIAEGDRCLASGIRTEVYKGDKVTIPAKSSLILVHA